MLVQCFGIDPAPPKQSEHSLTFLSLLLPPIAKLLKPLLPISFILALQCQSLPKLFQNLARIPKEILDIAPYDLVYVPAVDALRRALFSGKPIQAAGKLPPVAVVVVVGLAC